MLYRYSGIDKEGKYRRGTIDINKDKNAIKEIKEKKELSIVISLNKQDEDKLIDAMINKSLRAVEGQIEGLVNVLNESRKKKRAREKQKKEDRYPQNKRKKKENKKEDKYEKDKKVKPKKERKTLKQRVTNMMKGSSITVDKEVYANLINFIKNKEDEQEQEREEEKRIEKLSMDDIDRIRKEDNFYQSEEVAEHKEIVTVGNEEGKEINWELIEQSEENIEEKTYKRKVKEKEIILFTKRLQIMLASGMSLVNSLIVLAKTKNKTMAKIIEAIIEDVQMGNSFSWSLSKHPNQFDYTYVSLISIGETSGNLSSILLDIIDTKEQKQNLSRKIKTASIYPTIIGIVLGAVVILGSLFFIPMFESLFIDQGMALPKITQIVFGAARIVPYVAIGVAICIVIMKIIIKKNKNIKKKYLDIRDKIILKIPILKEIVGVLNMYNFSSTTALMLKNAIRLNDAVLLASKTVNNVHIRQGIVNVSTLLIQGFSFTKALSTQEYFDEILINIALTGEESGQMAFSLNQVARYYKDELEKNIERIIELVQPVSMLLIALIAVPVVLAVYLPIFDMSTGAGLGL